MAFKSVVRSTGPCGRVGYLTKKEAKAAARSHRPGAKMTAYRCPDERCNGLPWHLTGGQRPARES